MLRVVRDGKAVDLRALWYSDGTLYLLDQRKLPLTVEVFEAHDLEASAFAIEDMVVRGAPAIGAAAALAMAQADHHGVDLAVAAARLRRTRPTAHDLFFAIDAMERAAGAGKDLQAEAQRYVDDIVDRCRRIGEHGATLLREGSRVLTHCNAGALATVDWGTALAPLRVAHRAGLGIFVFADETRPRLQGTRLTAWELVNEGIPHALIADNAAGLYLRRGEIDLVLTGADRIVANGDVANKVGTYEKAVVAKAHGVPLYVAAPVSTFDLSIPDGDGIPIEERSAQEMTHIEGVRIAPHGVTVRNPAFDITPAALVAGYITEAGVFPQDRLERLLGQVRADHAALGHR